MTIYVYESQFDGALKCEFFSFTHLEKSHFVKEK